MCGGVEKTTRIDSLVTGVCDGKTGQVNAHERSPRRCLCFAHSQVQWAHLGSNQGPLACEASALPLSYAPGKVRGTGEGSLGLLPPGSDPVRNLTAPRAVSVYRRYFDAFDWSMQSRMFASSVLEIFAGGAPA
jgi:hypothetical protein